MESYMKSLIGDPLKESGREHVVIRTTLIDHRGMFMSREKTIQEESNAIKHQHSPRDRKKRETNDSHGIVT